MLLEAGVLNEANAHALVHTGSKENKDLEAEEEGGQLHVYMACSLCMYTCNQQCHVEVPHIVFKNAKRIWNELDAMEGQNSCGAEEVQWEIEHEHLMFSGG